MSVEKLPGTGACPKVRGHGNRIEIQTNASRKWRLPAAETALLSALEIAFAPLWAFLILSEAPAIPTVIGGAIVFVAIITSQMQSPKDRTT